jgi:hypothetical protein
MNNNNGKSIQNPFQLQVSRGGVTPAVQKKLDQQQAIQPRTFSAQQQSFNVQQYVSSAENNLLNAEHNLHVSYDPLDKTCPFLVIDLKTYLEGGTIPAGLTADQTTSFKTAAESLKSLQLNLNAHQLIGSYNNAVAQHTQAIAAQQKFNMQTKQ